MIVPRAGSLFHFFPYKKGREKVFARGEREREEREIGTFLLYPYLSASGIFSMQNTLFKRVDWMSA